MRRFKRVIAFVGINLAVVCLVLGGAEVYLRRSFTYVTEEYGDSLRELVIIESSPDLLVSYTLKGRRLIPDVHVVIRNHNLSKRDIRIDINSSGFRDDEVDEVKGDEGIRILALGDSITFGDYLPAAETFVERMEFYLNEWIKDRDIKVINAGVGDTGLKEAVDILEERGLAVKPDVVMVEFYLNDSRPPWGFPNELGRYGVIRRHSILAQYLYIQMELREWVRREGRPRDEWVRAVDRLDWKKDRDEFLKLASLAELDWGAAWDEQSWDIVDEQLEKLKSLSEEHGFSVAVVSFPVSYQVFTDFIEDEPQRVLKEKSEDLGFLYLDLLPILRKHGDQDIFFDNCHPKAIGNEIIGKEISEFLKENLQKLP